MRSDNPLTLTTEWQKGETVIDLSTIAPVTLSLFFELRGEGEALIDEVRLVDLADSSTKISPVTPHTVISDKASIPPIRFSTTKPETDASIMHQTENVAPSGKE
jgi:hypothetical protein